MNCFLMRLSCVYSTQSFLETLKKPNIRIFMIIIMLAQDFLTTFFYSVPRLSCSYPGNTFTCWACTFKAHRQDALWVGLHRWADEPVSTHSSSVGSIESIPAQHFGRGFVCLSLTTTCCPREAAGLLTGNKSSHHYSWKHQLVANREKRGGQGSLWPG